MTYGVFIFLARRLYYIIAKSKNSNKNQEQIEGDVK
jgi:hypothetical protein